MGYLRAAFVVLQREFLAFYCNTTIPQPANPMGPGHPGTFSWGALTVLLLVGGWAFILYVWLRQEAAAIIGSVIYLFVFG